MAHHLEYCCRKLTMRSEGYQELTTNSYHKQDTRKLPGNVYSQLVWLLQER